MKTYTTHNFSLQAPSQFEVQKENLISVWLYNPTLQSSESNLTVRVTLSHITSYNYIKKKTLQEQFCEANLKIRYKAETIETFETEINGKTCYVQLAKTDDVFQNKPLQISYYFVLMPLNAQYFIEMLCDVETKDWESYLPIFKEIFQTITFEGDLEKCQKAYDLYDEELTQAMKQDSIGFGVEREKHLLEWIENHIQSVEKMDTSIFKIDNTNFDLTWDNNASDKTQWGINQHFYCDIVATTKDVSRLKKERILSDYNDKGELKISFTYKGLFQNGLPKAEIQVIDSKIQANQYFSFRFDGTHYNLVYFDGKIFIDEKGVKILGCINDSMDRKIPVNIQIAFDVANLNWRKYQFSTLEELQSAPDGLVEKISFSNSPSIMPEDWQRFTKLKHLILGHRYQNSKVALTELPNWIKQFQALESLVISSESLTDIPNEVAELPHLKGLTIYNSKITQLPDVVWQMPSLERLGLSDNQINIISETVDLPKLKWLELTGNQLKILPESIGDLPNLSTLSLKRNPWEYLPENIENIATLNLEIAFKRKFFDYEYKGADGKGTIQWNDDIFFAKNDAELMQTINAYWQNETVKPFQKDLTELMKKSLGFSLGREEDYSTIGKHRIGGMPDFPKEMEYPRFGENWHEDKTDYVYEFIAQINCADVAHLQDYLPKTGILYFFLSTIHDIYDDSNAAKVIYFSGDTNELQSGKDFHFTENDYFESIGNIPYEGYQATAETFVDMPDFYPIRQNEYLIQNLSQSFKEYLANGDSGYELNELFDTYKKQDVSVNSYGFSQHEYPEHEVALKEKGNPKDWIILLKVPSVGDFQWGDAGDLFYVIHKSDLSKKDFSNVICTMYSS